MQRKYRLLILTSLLLSTMFSCQERAKDAQMHRFVSDLMNKMTIDEKIGQLNLVRPGGGVMTGSIVSNDIEQKLKEGKVGAIFGISGPQKIRKVQEIAVNNSRLGIQLLIGADVIHGYKTIFPIPLGLSCSWDTLMIKKTARIAAIEATADGIFWDFSPMVDIARDPRWGRIAEGSGEDPYLGSAIARVMVKGYQGDDLTQNNTMMATVKHFALYGAAEAGRDYNTVDMSRLRMYNDYLAPYKAAVDAGVGCVMSSFNDVDGIPSSGNKWLLTELLRKQWGFKGFVVSDYTSVNEMTNHGMGDLQAVSALALKAGLDMDMVGEGFLTTLKKSLDEGKVTEKEINTACRLVLEAKYKLGLFDDPYRYIDETRPAKEISLPEYRALAREAAQKSCVLLKNESLTLPLKKSGTIALVGPLANNYSNMNGAWAPEGTPETVVNVLEGLMNVVGDTVNIHYTKGANILDDPEYARKVNVFGNRVNIDERSGSTMIKEAVSIANRSDIIVAVVGEASEMSGESASRSSIQLPEAQKRLIRALAETEKPLILVVMSGRPLVLTEENEMADAILQTWHPGVEAGNAIAGVLFGNYNPSGKLSVTFPRDVGQIPIYYSVRTTGRPQNGDTFQKFKSNYLDVENSPLYPFGYGLSYTRFDYSNLLFDKNAMSVYDTLEVAVDISNTGSVEGEEVVQLYIHDKVASITRPVKELKGFRKINLKPSEKKTVKFYLTSKAFGFYDFNGDFIVEPGEFDITVGPSSAKGLLKQLTIKP